MFSNIWDIWYQDQWLEYEECDHHAHVSAARHHHYATDHRAHVDAYEFDSIPF